MNRVSYQDHTDFLKGVSDYFAQHTNAEGKNICAKHKVEHTGKTVYSVGVDTFLYEFTGDRMYFDRALQRAKRVVSLLKEIKGQYVFVPDGSEKWNMSNHVIDSGAASDSLATFLLKFGSELSREDYDLIYDAVEKNADTYLIGAAVEKAPTNQRLWGATGLASSYKLTPKDTWKEAMIASVERSLGEFRSDGSIPYVTAYEGHNDPSANDITTYYHSRHLIFMWYVLDSIDGVTDARREKLMQATDFLAGMYQRNFVKNISLETKHWYFLSSYEVASHSYDAAAFARAFAETNESHYFTLTHGSLAELYRHRVRPDHGINDHFGRGTNFQCPYFWNSHTAWLTRIPRSLFEDTTTTGKSYNTETEYFADADLLCVHTENMSCKFRGSNQPRHLRMGHLSGGGSLIYFGQNKNDFENVLTPDLYQYRVPLNFYLETSQGVREMFPKPLSEMRALLYRIRVELRAYDPKAVYERFRIFYLECFRSFRRLSSAYATQVELKRSERTVTYTGMIADLEGKRFAAEHTLSRTYAWNDEQLSVTEELSFSNPLLRNLSYIIIPAIADLKVKSDVSYHKTQKSIRFKKGAKTITITYTLGTAS